MQIRALTPMAALAVFLLSIPVAAGSGQAPSDSGGGVPVISIDDVSVTEGDFSNSTATFTVALSTASSGTVMVDFATVDGTATTASNDYVAASGTLAFPPGVVSQPVYVTVIGDTNLEPTQAFLVDLSNPVNATLGDGQGIGTIVNDDGPPGAALIGELHHGYRALGNLAAVGGAEKIDYYHLSMKPYTSYLVQVDATSGDIAAPPASSLHLELTAADGTTVQALPHPVSPLGFTQILTVANLQAMEVNDRLVRVRSASCTTDCGPDDVYQIRAFETTYAIPRFNNSGTQTTVLVVHNRSSEAVNTVIMFWGSGGNLIDLQGFTVAAKGTLVLSTALFAPGVGGSITVAHSGQYDALTGKTVALEPATGFSFDSPMQPRVKVN